MAIKILAIIRTIIHGFLFLMAIRTQNVTVEENSWVLYFPLINWKRN